MSADRLGPERGATAVIVAVVIVALIGLGALAVDVGHLYLSRGELQNAADACALAGAAVLYADAGAMIDPSETINAGANRVGHDAGETNQSQKSAAEINWTSGNEGDVQRGHWNPLARSFTPNDSTVVTELRDKTTAELNADTGFVNAVRCVARREATPVSNILAPVLGLFVGGAGLATSIVRAEAVGYLGFAAQVEPHEFDQPIALCQNKLLNGECANGRMFSANYNAVPSQTAKWTNFSVGCAALADEASVGAVVADPISGACGRGNETALPFGSALATKTETTEPVEALPGVFAALRASCWPNALTDHDNDPETPKVPVDSDGDGIPDRAWKITLPVIDCQNDACNGNGNELKGVASVEVVWITDALYDGDFARIPRWMRDDTTEYACLAGTGNSAAEIAARKACWRNFVTAFALANDGGVPMSTLTIEDYYLTDTVYYKPGCTPPPIGRTGGENLGVLAKYPALVN